MPFSCPRQKLKGPKQKMICLFAGLVSASINLMEDTPAPTPAPTVTMRPEMLGMLVSGWVGILIWVMAILGCTCRGNEGCLCNKSDRIREYANFLRDPTGCDFYRWFIKPPNPLHNHWDEWNDDKNPDFFLQGLQQILDELPDPEAPASDIEASSPAHGVESRLGENEI